MIQNMKKLIYLLLAAGMVVLASCGEEEGVHLKNFKIELTEPATSTSFKVKVTPSNAEQYYMATFVLKRDFVRNGPQYYVDYYQNYLKEHNTYPAALYQGEYLGDFTGQLPGTEYVVFAYPVRAGYELDGTIDAFEYATFKTPDIEYEEVPGTFELRDVSYETNGNYILIATDDKEAGMRLVLYLVAPTWQRNFTEDDFLHNGTLQDKYSPETTITHAELRGIINDLNSTYILRGTVCTADGKKYTIGLHMSLTVPGEFSVGKGEDDKVYFSRGNLQYRASTKTWRFAPYQWMVIGEDNAMISDTYDGWIDLFGWGTGDAPTKSSRQDADYATFTDWGDNVIVNGSAEPGVWRTLESDEWDYLFHGRPNAAKLFGYMTIMVSDDNQIEGVFLLPDDWDASSAIASVLKTAEDQGFVWNDEYYRWLGPEHAAANCKLSSYYQWMLLERAGVVFLPVKHYREGTTIYNGGISSYWSATPYEGEDKGRASSIILRPDELILAYYNRKYSGRSVRLVKDK